MLAPTSANVQDRQQAPAPSTVLPVLLAAFSMIALDVAAPLSLHLLQPLDSTVHAFMQAHVPYDVRLIADKPMSNWPILAGCGASAALAGVVAWRRPVQGLTAAGLWAVMNSLGARQLCPHTCCCSRTATYMVLLTIFSQTARATQLSCKLCVTWCTCWSLITIHTAHACAVGGVFLNADAKGTLLLKRAIGRARPSDLHGGFSFPSGHATTAYFVLGWLLFILVPLAAEALQSDNAPTNGDLPPSEAGGLQAGAAQALRRLSSAYVALPLLLLAAGTTQVGRLTADVHWCSDVVAGALLGSAGVAVSALLLQAVLRQKQVES